jgi:hypothetical protein
MEDSDGFIFFKGLDSTGYDLKFVGRKSVSELKKISNNDVDSVGFNTLGFMKHDICKPDQFVHTYAYTDKNDGLYVDMKKYAKIASSKRSFKCFKDYKFYPNLDSPNGDMVHLPNVDLESIKEYCDNNPTCTGFNTLGYVKKVVVPEGDMTSIQSYVPNSGLYVKQKKTRIKMICNWCSSKQLCDEWNRMSQGNYRWNNIEITWENDVDLYVIINKPLGNEHYVPSKTIVFQMEPWCGDANQNWGVKTWGEWASPELLGKFLHVRTHKSHFNNCFWQLNTTYNEFKTLPIIKNDSKLLSSICSSKYFDPGHIKRIDFIKFVES